MHRQNGQNARLYKIKQIWSDFSFYIPFSESCWNKWNKYETAHTLSMWIGGKTDFTDIYDGFWNFVVSKGTQAQDLYKTGYTIRYKNYFCVE